MTTNVKQLTRPLVPLFAAALVTSHGVPALAQGWTDDGPVVRLTTSTDRVGIGTTSPESTLHVVGGARIGHSSGNDWSIDTLGGGDHLTFVSRPAAGGATNRVTFRDNGRVGIGTTSPESILHVVGGARIGHSSGNDWSIDTLGGGDHLTFVSRPAAGGATNRVTFRDNGRVGIGTTNPGSLLHVNNGDIRVTDNDFARMRMTATAPATDVRMFVDARSQGGFNRGQLGTLSNHDLLLFTNSQARLTVENSGRIGIGTTNPDSRLHVNNGDIRITDNEFARLRMTATAPTTDVRMFIDARSQGGIDRGQLGTLSNHDLVLFTNSQRRIVIESDGGVCIGNC